MSHQSQLEKSKYRNWVRGGLAFKYLKEGIEGFADDVVEREHTRILGAVSNTSGNACNRCDLKYLKSNHKYKVDLTTGQNTCPLGQSRCNCLYPRKKKSCPNKVCDVIMEEILKSHGSTPPTPNWKNTDVNKWYTSPWEIAKCFINAPGYSDKTKAADIDMLGLLHLFINNINLQSHLSCNMTGTNIFIKCRERRNKLFHSPEMELKDDELTECIDDIIAILADPKELGARADAQQTLSKLEQLKRQCFIISTHNEAEVCRDALAFITNKTVELNHIIQEATDDIDRRHTRASKAIDDKMQVDLQKALENNSDIIFLKQSVELLTERVNNLEEDNFQTKLRLLEIEKNIDELQAVKDQRMEKLKYVQEKQALQCGLVKLYQHHYVKTSLSPLKLQENDININDVYITPNLVVYDDSQQNETGNSRFEADAQEEKTNNGFYDLFQTNGQDNKAIYIVGDVGTGKSSLCKMMIQDWCEAVNKGIDGSCVTNVSYRTCAMTDDINKDGTSKSRDEFDNIENKIKAILFFLEPSPFFESEDNNYSYSVSIDGIKEKIRTFNFLFYIPLQKMSKYCEIITMIQTICTNANIASNDLLQRVFEEDSESCLILLDGLDEWSPQQMDSVSPHENSGLPIKQGIKNATVITLSRPSAKGMLNIKRSEFDLQVELMGICSSSVNRFIEIYLSALKNAHLTSKLLMKKIRSSNLEHVEQNPLLLQQLVWLYHNNIDFGTSISGIYSHLVNIMLAWFQTKTEMDESEGEGDNSNKNKHYNKMTLPSLLNKFPRCREKKIPLIQLARLAFESLLTTETENISFGRSQLRETGFSATAVSSLIKFGILFEENCYDPTQERTQLSFTHYSYLEYFVAVYVSCQTENQPPRKVTSVLKELFRNCEFVGDILQLSNLLRMICGLCPRLISQVSQLVSDIVKRDESINTSYRNEDLFLEFKKMTSKLFIIQIQRLIFSFLYECDKGFKPKVYLSDLVLIKHVDMATLRRINPDNVLSLYSVFIEQEDFLRWITQLKQLQHLSVSDCCIPHTEMTLISNFLQQQNTSVKCLKLSNVCCKQDDCSDHSIDLSKQKQLQKLNISNCWDLRLSSLNTKNLKIIHLDNAVIQDINLLAYARHLTEMSLRYHTYDEQVNSVVQTLHQLRTLKLSYVHIDENALTVTSKMRNLKTIELNHANSSLATWSKFVDSLLTLQQYVRVNTFDNSSGFASSRLLNMLQAIIGNPYSSIKERIEYVRNTKNFCEKENVFNKFSFWKKQALK